MIAKALRRFQIGLAEHPGLRVAVVVLIALACGGCFVVPELLKADTADGDAATPTKWFVIVTLVSAFVVNIVANLASSQLESRFSRSDRSVGAFWRNHHLLEGFAKAVEMVVRRATQLPGPQIDDAARVWLDAHCQTLPEVVNTAVTRFPPEDPRSPFRSLAKDQFWRLLLPHTHRLAGMPVEGYRTLIDQWCGDPSVRIAASLRDYLARQLHADLGTSLHEALKDDFVNDGYAWSSLAQTALTSLQAIAAEIADELKELRGEVQDLHSDVRVSTEVVIATHDGVKDVRSMVTELHKDRFGPGGPPGSGGSDTNFTAAGVARNPLFVGRVTDMKALRAALFPPADGHVSPGAALTQGFTGEGGIGKSQLAQRFAELTCAALRVDSPADDAAFPPEQWVTFDCAWWLDCSTTGHAQAVRALATLLGHVPTPQDTPATLRAAIRVRLADGRKHLLILDNLEAMSEAEQAADGSHSQWARAEGWALPAASRVVITTREQHLPGPICPCVELGVLSVEDARALLRSARADLAAPAHDAGLDAVADHLGRLALAVDLSRAWLKIHVDKSPADLLQKLRQSDAAALALFEHDRLRDQAHRYRVSVASSLSLHMDALAGTPAEAVLSAAAFAAPDGIPNFLLRAATGLDEDAFEDALVSLHAKTIVHRQPTALGGSVSLHRLTQAVVRARLAQADPTAAGHLYGKWFKAIHELHREDDHDEIRPRRTAAAVHVTALADRALEDAGAAQTHWDAAVCQRWNADQFFYIGNLADAEAAIAKAVNWAEPRGPARKKSLMVFLATRSRIRRGRGDLAGAEADLARSIAWGEAQTPPDERNLAIWYAQRASIRQDRGDLAGAEADIARSIEWGEAQTPRDERDLAILYAQRAGIRQACGDLSGAEADLARSIAWGEAQTPPDGRSLAIDYAMRAGIRQARGDLAGAEADIARSIAWGESQTPRDERSLAIDYASRAIIRRQGGDLAGAEADLARSIAWGESQTPRDERSLAIRYAQRAGIRQDRGDLSGAEADIARSIAWGEAQTPRDERSLAIDYARRARIHQDLGRAAGKAGEKDAAESWFVKARADIAAALQWYEANLSGDERAIRIMQEIRDSIPPA